MSDIIADMFAFLVATEEVRVVEPGQDVICSVCGRKLDEGEEYRVDGLNEEPYCPVCAIL